MTDGEQTATRTAPTCYRHPDRETWVSCGKCGKPLCPDCMMHGPVGVRCRECLVAPVSIDRRPVDPARLPVAAGIGGGVALVVAALLVGLAWFDPRLLSPNLLLCALAGGVIGRIVRRTCADAWDRRSVSVAVSLATLAPILAAVVIAMLDFGGIGRPFALFAYGLFTLRVVVAAVLALLAAWLFSTGRS